MANIKIVIADERIYKNNVGKQVMTKANYKNNQKIGHLNLLREKMGVSVVAIRGERVNPKEIYKDKNRGHFLVIHQGLIDKMSDKGGFLTKVKKYYEYIVIDSGRGVPEDLAKGTRYIEIGALERFIDDLDKYSLVQTLYSLRRPNNV